ncbi:MAG TPA: ComEC/Rec2 family competence protein [Chroococcidiopsis sp.]
MSAIAWSIVCGAYIVGLLCTAIPGSVRGMPMGAIVLVGVGAIASLIAPRLWRTGPRSRLWLVAGLIGGLAALTFQMRLPQPDDNDISHWLTASGSTQVPVPVQVRGWIDSSPRLTRSQRIQFQLRVQGAGSASPAQPSSSLEPATGNLYVTVPLLQGTGLYDGQTVTITGQLYAPKPAENPGGFDFQAYLRQQGIFAGMTGDRVEAHTSASLTPASRTPASLTASPSATPSLWSAPRRWLQHRLWQIRQRIIQAQVQGLGVPNGPLLSVMVMGRNGVDLPYDLKDQFTRVGLAHALAASGAQVSLLVGVMLGLTRRLSARMRLIVGVGTILVYVGLTGIQPAVLRAGIMGVATLYAMVAERKVRPLGSLLLSATLLLLWNPGWIWDLGFQFSFLATLGLLVTVPVLNQWLDWLPTAIAPLIAVPIAAYLWTVPLQLYVFGVISPYSIPINLLTTPLIAIVSIGGMVSALAGLLYPPMGSLLAWLLYFPSEGLIQLAVWGDRIPGNAFSVGTIDLVQLLLLYGLIGLVWQQRRLHRYWWAAAILAVGLVAIPAGYTALRLTQVTVLATAGEPAIVVQSQGTVGLVSSSQESTVNYTVLPFLRQAGINQVQWAIAPSLTDSSAEGWLHLSQRLPVQSFYSSPKLEVSPAQPSAIVYQALGQQLGNASPQPLASGAPIAVGNDQITLLNEQPMTLQLVVNNQRWLLIPSPPNADNPEKTRPPLTAKSVAPADVLWWNGKELSPDVLAVIQPKVAIASGREIDPKPLKWLQAHHATVYATGRDGAIAWTPNQGFRSTLRED